MPQWNPGDQNQQDVIEGTVSGARQGQRLVIYSKSGGLWWLQPLLTSPFTAILPDQVWRNETHLGTEYAVLLVDSSFHPAAILESAAEAWTGHCRSRSYPRAGEIVILFKPVFAHLESLIHSTLSPKHKGQLPMKKRILAVLLVTALCADASSAQFGFGQIVSDTTNYANAVLRYNQLVRQLT